MDRISALLHALPAGRHEISAHPSAYWAWPTAAAAPALTVITCARLGRSCARACAVAEVRHDWCVDRSAAGDVCGGHARQRNGGPPIYVIFSNEDGGTATPALLARWGRTTDIEMAYEEEWRGGEDGGRTIPGARSQSDRVCRREARENIRHSLMPRSTTYSSIGVVRRYAITMVPTLVEPGNGDSRVGDGQARRGSIAGWRTNCRKRERRPSTATCASTCMSTRKLTLSDSAVAAVARGEDGTWRSSDRGIRDFAVDRNGWVRIAIPQLARGDR